MKIQSIAQWVTVRFVAGCTDLNIGVILICPVPIYAGAKFLASWGRIANAFPTADRVEFRRLKRYFDTWCEAWVGTQQPELLTVGDLSIRFSKPISIVTVDPEATLAAIFRLYVAKDEVVLTLTRDA